LCAPFFKPKQIKQYNRELLILTHWQKRSGSMCVDNPVQLAYLLGLQEKLMYKQNDFVIGKN